jgi:hypothetical protein
MRVLCTILPLMVFSMARRSTGVQLVFSSSLELAVYISNSFSDILEGIIFPRLVLGYFLPFGKYDCKGAFIFDFGWMWMVIQSTSFPSTTSAYTIHKMERGHSLRSTKGVS